MQVENTSEGELILIRHAPNRETGYLIGRTDVSARIDAAAIADLIENLPVVSDIIVSPAKRCVETAMALWPNQALRKDARLWEQDFGCNEGARYADLPDIGVKTNQELARYRPEGGESFDDLCARSFAAMKDWSAKASTEGKTIALVVHAGTIRAALGLAMGNSAAALSFEIDHLSITRLRAGHEGPVSIRGVNLT